MELKEGLTVSEIMHDLNANYTKYFNAKYERKGHLFRERYKMRIIEKDTYILKTITYILRNPVALGLVGKSAEYGYSSYKSQVASYTSQVTDDSPQSTMSNSPQVDMQEEMREIGSRCRNDAEPVIASEAKQSEELRSFAKKLARKSVLGSEDFLKKVEEARERCVRERKASHPVNRRFILAGTAVVLILGIVTFHLYRTTMARQFQSEIDSYYKGISRNLEMEKQKVKVLEQRLGVRK